ncbi:hypothetical protein [Aeromonas veronii]|uniref:hypothetical protein n=1 Tax=Aeromonas TaxID=642 RepID=UPI0011DE0D9B|nr:hypothetical protein [Aeromonas veronii]MCF5763336.1 hypothetical protein [Aeromonas veronii]
MAHRYIPLPMLLLFDVLSGKPDWLHQATANQLLTPVNERKSKRWLNENCMGMILKRQVK